MKKAALRRLFLALRGLNPARRRRGAYGRLERPFPKPHRIHFPARWSRPQRACLPASQRKWSDPIRLHARPRQPWSPCRPWPERRLSSLQDPSPCQSLRFAGNHFRRHKKKLADSYALVNSLFSQVANHQK